MSARIDALSTADVALIVMALAVLAGRLDPPGREDAMRLARDIATGLTVIKGTTS